MIGGAVYSWRFGGANIVERTQSANRCDQLHINFLILSLAMIFISISIYACCLLAVMAKESKSGF